MEKIHTPQSFLNLSSFILHLSFNLNRYSSCPSSQKGGSLGSFGRGAMVPAFDEVVFNKEVGVVHGPVKTPFGAHLILIESRTEP